MTDAYSEWKRWEAGDFGRFSALDACYYDWHVRRALPGRPPALDVLEIGFGNGGFAGWVLSVGGRVVGVETNPRLVDLARQRGLLAHAHVDEIEAASRFDLIAGFDVLEHVSRDELPALLKKLAALLKPGGCMLFRFPNAESPLGLHLQHGDLTHVSALGASAMRQLATALDLELAHVGDSLPWRAYPASRRLGAALAQLSRRLLEWRLRKSFRLGRSFDMSPNQTVVLRLPARTSPG